MMVRVDNPVFWAVALATVFAGCSANSGITGSSGISRSTDTSTDATANATVDTGGTGSGSGGGGGSGGGDDSGVSDSGTGTGAGSIADIIQQCGVTQDELNNPSAVVFNTTMHSFPKVYTGTQNEPLIGAVNFRVTVTVVLTISATATSETENTDFQVVAEPQAAEAQAQQQVAPNRGTNVSQGLDTQGRVQLSSTNKDWSGILCTVEPVTQMVVNRGQYTKTITFDPPLPNGVSPKATIARYQTEIPQARTFSNIKATVSNSTDPNAPNGTTIVGSVNLTPLTPQIQIQVGDGGGSQTINTDAAYRLDFLFGDSSGSADQQVGLMPSQSYFIDAQNHNIKVVVADTGDPNTGQVVLSPDL
jgi:hypothetical protein